MPSRVVQGVAEFGETLRQRCTVYGVRNANHTIKYDAKLFTLSVVALDVDELELGKHHIDLSRLLPEEDVDDDDAQHANSWSTNFELSGIAKGSTLIVTFNYDLLHHETSEESDDMPPTMQSSLLTNSVPNFKHDLPQILASDPISSQSHSEPGVDADHYSNIEHLSLDEEGATVKNPTIENEDNGASVLSDVHSVLGTSFELKPSLNDYFEEEGRDKFTSPPVHSQASEVKLGVRDAVHVDDKCRLTTEEYMDRSKNVSEEWSESREAQVSQLEGSDAGQRLYEETSFMNGLETDLDDEVDLVAGEFLDMLDFGFSSRHFNSEGEPDSPRARLLKQFECDNLFGDGMDLRLENATVGKGSKLTGTAEEQFPVGFRSTPTAVEELGQGWESEDGMQLALIMEAAESELQKAAQTMRSKSRAKVLEDEETQALMQEWGLSEKSFQNSPPKSMSSFGSPFLGPHLNAPHSPSLGNGLGSVLNLKDGGSLRSMSPSHFPKNKASGSLVMQVSKPVVVPSAMGSSTVDILRHLASFGTETLAKQAMAAMPLEDITGKMAEEVAAMGSSATLGLNQRERLSFQYGNRHQNTTFSGGQSGIDFDGHGSRQASSNMRLREKLADRTKNGGYDDYVSLEDLAPLAMQNIEALAIDGLKIQTDMAEEEAPSYLDAAAWGILEDLKKQDKDSIGLSQGVAGMHFKNLQSGENFSSDVKHDGPLSMAITLEEWTKLDAGVLDDDANSNEKSLAILAAHNAHHQDWELINRGETKRGHTRRGGNMGSTLMIAMLVQLRDPLQNFEPVGAPMMALIQAERVMVPPKLRVGRIVSTKGNSEDDDEVKETAVQKEEVPQFKLTGVHMSGLKTADDEAKVGKGAIVEKKSWGSQKQLQSGSRWLVAQGMGKASKHSLLKSKPAPPSQTKVKPGETLWSISARVHGSGHKWRDLAALNPHIRNPDVIFTNDTIRTK